MTWRRRACRALAVATASLASVPVLGLVAAPHAGAATVTKTAYWVKLGVALPIVPKGGLLVGDDPTAAVNPNQPPPLPIPLPVAPPHVSIPGPQLNGYTAVSAMRITGIPPGADVTMTLPLVPGSIPPLPTVSTLIACPIDPSWRAPSGPTADVSTAPLANCNTPSVAKLSTDNLSLVWLLPASYQQNPGEVDIELQPGVVSVPLPYLVAFASPTPRELKAANGSPLATVAPATPPQVTPVVPSPSTGFGDSTPAVASGPVQQPTAPPSASPTVTAVPSPSLVTRLGGVSLPGVSDDRSHRVMSVVLLLAIAAAWWWIGGRPTRAPRRLGALAVGGQTTAETVGGIGRFRRVRETTPPRL